MQTGLGDELALSPVMPCKSYGVDMMSFFGLFLFPRSSSGR